jgi:hypothetical protein
MIAPFWLWSSWRFAPEYPDYPARGAEKSVPRVPFSELRSTLPSYALQMILRDNNMVKSVSISLSGVASAKGAEFPIATLPSHVRFFTI